jgi:hypothetical protein
MLQNRIYRGEIVHKERSVAQRNAGGRTAQPSLLAGLLFDSDGNRMTPSYRYYVSRPLITKDRPDQFAGWRIPAGEIGPAPRGR